MPIEFITTRVLEGENKAAPGSVRIMKMKEDDYATVKYKCPECGHEEQRKEGWTEPFLTGTGAKKKIRLACGKCGHMMEFLKLAKQIKKEEKAAKAKKAKS